MITNERWKDIKGFTRYEVSDLGRVRNKYNKKLKAIRRTKNGYCITDLKEEGVKSTKYIHRLVSEAFVDNPNNLPCVNHKDEDKTNNRFDNLEWCTVAYNNTYNDRAKKVGKHHRTHHPLCKHIRCIETGEIFTSVRDAGRKTNICSMSISYCLNGKQKTAGGHRWEVIE